MAAASSPRFTNKFYPYLHGNHMVVGGALIKEIYSYMPANSRAAQLSVYQRGSFPILISDRFPPISRCAP